ncbi:MAG TPA: dienelactone hydrolase family protein [Acidobacteriota bacterium]|nr:dienelactone hydrolase family protein [Acidobacteriota bacterium]
MRKKYLGILVALLAGISLGLWLGAQQGTVTQQATGEDQLPSALLGQAPPLQGDPVAYYPDDPKSLGYLAVPDEDGPHGAVILIHEWNGLVDRVRQVADALAAEGYVALAADLYSGRTGSSREENMALVREARGNPEKLIANLDAAAKFLRERDDVSGKIAAMGWCFGGGVALSYALGGENHEGTAIFYGRLLTDPEELRVLNHEVYGTFAANDGGIPPEEVNKFVDALRQIGIDNDVHIYDDVGHGFWLHTDQDPETRQKPALDAWQRLKAYLKRTIG